MKSSSKQTCAHAEEADTGTSRTLVFFEAYSGLQRTLPKKEGATFRGQQCGEGRSGQILIAILDVAGSLVSLPSQTLGPSFKAAAKRPESLEENKPDLIPSKSLCDMMCNAVSFVTICEMC